MRSFLDQYGEVVLSGLYGSIGISTFLFVLNLLRDFGLAFLNSVGG